MESTSFQNYSRRRSVRIPVSQSPWRRYAATVCCPLGSRKNPANGVLWPLVQLDHLSLSQGRRLFTGWRYHWPIYGPGFTVRADLRFIISKVLRFIPSFGEYLRCSVVVRRTISLNSRTSSWFGRRRRRSRTSAEFGRFLNSLVCFVCSIVSSIEDSVIKSCLHNERCKGKRLQQKLANCVGPWPSQTRSA